jgi:hypothetical protein
LGSCEYQTSVQLAPRIPDGSHRPERGCAVSLALRAIGTVSATLSCSALGCRFPRNCIVVLLPAAISPGGGRSDLFVRNLPPMRFAIRHSHPAQPLCGLPTVQVHGGSTSRVMTLVAPRACTNKAEGRMYLSSRRGVKRAGIVGAGGSPHCRGWSQKTVSWLTMRVRSPTRPSRSRFARARSSLAASPPPPEQFDDSPLNHRSPSRDCCRSGSRRDHRAKYGCLSTRPKVRCLCPPGKTQHLLPKLDRPGSDR